MNYSDVSAMFVLYDFCLLIAIRASHILVRWPWEPGGSFLARWPLFLPGGKIFYDRRHFCIFNCMVVEKLSLVPIVMYEIENRHILTFWYRDIWSFANVEFWCVVIHYGIWTWEFAAISLPSYRFLNTRWLFVTKWLRGACLLTEYSWLTNCRYVFPIRC